MSELFEHYSLKTRNSFGIEVSTRYFFEATCLDVLLLFIKERPDSSGQLMIMGEGSNILFTRSFDGTIIHPAFKGIEVLSENSEKVQIKVQSGENWDDFVSYCVKNNWSGLENLSLIPGSVGSSPIQNIGAYGMEVKDCIIEVEGVFIDSGKHKVFSNHDCHFDYRSSIFKSELKNKFIITSVSFELNKNYEFILGYGSVEKEFRKKPLQNLQSLRQTIIEIRESKLPDPRKLGNAGSFFKNPVIPNSNFTKLQEKHPDIPFYPAGTEHSKIPAAWLIEHAGWKGVREGNTGTFPGQPLVIVNYGDASGKEILDFAKKITDSVFEIFGVKLETEVNLFV